jgi:peptidoglycan/LPS O-acetylase OafA/YrhL
VEAMIRTSKALHIENVVVQNIFIYSTSVTLALGIAWLSFNYYEDYFLKLKGKKFTTDVIPVINRKAVQQPA